MDSNPQNIGEIFKERRALAQEQRMMEQKKREKQQQQQKEPQAITGTVNQQTEVGIYLPKRPSLLEIQQEQEAEERKKNVTYSMNQRNDRGNRNRNIAGNSLETSRRNRSNNSLGAYFSQEDLRVEYDSNSRSGNSKSKYEGRDNVFDSRGFNGVGRNTRRGGFHRTNSRLCLPREEGAIVSLLDSFGFIRCAERDEDIFFHYSEVDNTSHPSDLEIGDEVRFDIGLSTKSQKNAAFNVSKLPKGTVKWEIPDTPEGIRTTGKIEYAARNNNSNSDYNSQNDGVIMLIESRDLEVIEKQNVSEAESENNNRNDIVKVFYRVEEYIQQRGQPTRLMKGDKIEFNTVIERRTGKKYAKEIILIQSERERIRQIKEEKMLAEATLERGVVASLLNDGGFLRSIFQRDLVYFQYSNVIFPENSERTDESEEYSLAEGQDMEFLVCKDDSNGRNKNHRIFAMKIKFLPKNSVQFHNNIADGVVGDVVRIPIPKNKQSFQKKSGIGSGPTASYGKIRLKEPLTINDNIVTEVLIDANDAPGGVYAANRDGSQLGLWINEGDTLLFDVIQEILDGSYHAKGTLHSFPNQPKDESNAIAITTDIKVKKEIKLIRPSLAGRTHGKISALKDGYGFIACSERAIDIYFRLYELFPASIQSDINNFHLINKQKEETIAAETTKLSVGTEVMFDILVTNPNLQHHNHHHRKSKHHDKENLIGKRICIVPKGSFVIDVMIAKSVRATVTQEHKDKSGVLELESAVKGMSRDQRHPFVAELLNNVNSKGETVTYPNVQGINEAQVIMSMAEERDLDVSFIDSATDAISPDPTVNGYGKLMISKPNHKLNSQDTLSEGKEQEHAVESSENDAVSVSSTCSGENNKKPKNRKKKKHAKKLKPVKQVRYERGCEAHDHVGGPPGLGDVVDCDIIQSRRTGAYSAINLKVLERKMIERKSIDAASGTGIVTEIVPARDFGFITQIDDHGLKEEVIFFHLSSVNQQESGDTQNIDIGGKLNRKSKGRHGLVVKNRIKRGDEVRFDIGEHQKSGKRVALNINILSTGTLNIPSKAEKNACEGIILMEPSHTSLSNTPAHASSINTHHSKNSRGRWSDLSDAKAKKESGSSMSEDGLILLLSDPDNRFSNERGKKKVTKIESAISKSSKNQINESADENNAVYIENDVMEDMDKESNSSTIQLSRKASLIHVSYRSADVAIRGNGAFSSIDESGGPHRGDLVSFVKGKGSSNKARDIRLISRSSATTKCGHLKKISLKDGYAEFVPDDNKDEKCQVDLNEVISCDVKFLKEDTRVECIFHDGQFYGGKMYSLFLIYLTFKSIT